MRALAPAPIWPEGRGLWLARPLLDHRRADLRKLLIEKGAAWIEDPANSNPDFARVRMRARLAEMEEGGFDPMSLCAEALAHQSRAEAQDEAARILLAGACALKHGEAALDKTAWLNAEPETRRRALSVLIAAIAGAEREAPSDAIARLDDAMARPDFSGAALGGALVRPGFKLGRDPGAILGRADGARPAAPLILPQARPVIWDNRVEITAARAGSQIVPGPRGCPLLERAHAVQALADAEAAGEIRAHWLTEAHIAQLLPSENAAFTPS
jgi:tRNA(Ile)-lysidine synthase